MGGSILVKKKRKPEDEVWYVHAPLKKGNRKLVTVPPPSQIPYLNGMKRRLINRKSCTFEKLIPSTFVDVN